VHSNEILIGETRTRSVRFSVFYGWRRQEYISSLPLSSNKNRCTGCRRYVRITDRLRKVQNITE
jgi:hypothetical protein